LTLPPIAPATFALHQEVLTNLNSSAWLVLVCKGGTNIALELARLDKRLLVVEADPEQAEELHRQLAEQTISGLTVYCELLGPEVGTTCWHYYNDSRQNGTTGLEALQSHYPNLRLQSQGTRRLQRLDKILTTWEKLVKNTGNGPLEGAGTLLTYGVEALPLLQGGGNWLERFSQLVVPAPDMETGGEIEMWSGLLTDNCLQPSPHIPQSDGGSNWILLKQDRERLLEKHLQLLVDRISAVEAARNDLSRNQQTLTEERNGLSKQNNVLVVERDGLKADRIAIQAERDELSNKHLALTTQRDGLSQQNDILLAQRDALQAERDDLSNKHLDLTTQRDGLSQQNDILLAQRDALQAERDDLSNKHLDLTTQRDGLSQQNDILLAQRDALQAERDELSNKHLALTVERDSFTKELEVLISQRDGFATNKQELTIENHDLLEERNSLQSRVERLTEVLQTSNKQLSKFKSIYSSLIIAYQDSRNGK
jgi:uncharacterized coiled-coil DUF342 family protein